MLVSELVSKKVIALDSAEEIGIVANVLFSDDFSQGKFLHVLSENETRPESCYLPLNKIFSYSDAIVLRHDEIVTELPFTRANPINCSAFSADGKLLGRVTDVQLNGVKVRAIITENGEFEPKKLISVSNDILIFNTSNKPIKINRRPRVSLDERKTELLTLTNKSPANNSTQNHSSNSVTQQTETEQKNDDVTLTAQQSTSSKQIGVPVPPLIQPSDTTVTRSPIINLPFLIGKTVRVAITDAGNVIIPVGTVVTSEVIDVAKAHNKLVQLALRAY